MKTMKNKIPERLKELMIECYTTQSKLAEDIKVSQSQIAKWLAGTHQPTADNIFNLAVYFKCSADYLLGLID